jgi:hypothetical protein
LYVIKPLPQVWLFCQDSTPRTRHFPRPLR